MRVLEARTSNLRKCYHIPSRRILHSRRSFFESSSSVRSIAWLRFFWSPSSLLELLIQAPMVATLETGLYVLLVEARPLWRAQGDVEWTPNRYFVDAA